MTDLPAPLELEELRRLLAEATPGPWEMDSVTTECGLGKYDTYEITAGSGSMNVVVEFSNATVATIYEEADEDGCHRWDDQSRNNAKLIVAAVNALPALLALAEEVEPAKDLTADLEPVPLAERQGSEWKPIETAPKAPIDSPECWDVLVSYSDGPIMVMYWADGWWPSQCEADEPWSEPNHWMPLPEPPK